jgi:transcriptional regulator with XRE-family HTH domain
MEKSTIHHGRNIRRFRDMLQIKQEALADKLGDNWTQSQVSRLESKEEIDDPTLKEVSKALGIPVEAIKNFDEQAAIVNIQSNHENANAGSGTIGNNLNYYSCTFNPIEEWLKVLEENKKLYERLLASEQEKVEIMKKAAGK